MRKALTMSAALLSLGLGSALAQTNPNAPMPMPGDTSMTGMHPMRGQHGAMARGSRSMHPARAAADPDAVEAPRSGEYRGGVGSPRSNAASNTTSANTRSEIAPRLPDPNAAGNTPEAYLAAAQRALAAGHTGAAQEALERAETRALTRSTDPSVANNPDQAPMVQQIGDARRALANRDTAAAKSAIAMAMGDRTPGLNQGEGGNPTSR